jgi:hypothetical protein
MQQQLPLYKTQKQLLLIYVIPLELETKNGIINYN